MKNNEFKTKKSRMFTKYVLESSSAGATGSSAIASQPTSLGELQRRLSELKNKVAGPAPKPRNPVAANVSAGHGGGAAGAMTDRKKASKEIRKQKHKGRDLWESDLEGIGNNQQKNKPVLVGMYLYNVRPGEEEVAAHLGVKQIGSGRWALKIYNTSGYRTNFRKNEADRNFGPGTWRGMGSHTAGSLNELKIKKDGDNFTADDLKGLEKIKDLSELKAKAFALITTPSKKPISDEKVAYFKRNLEQMTRPDQVLKLMWNLLLGGEGLAMRDLGGRQAQAYHRRFKENDSYMESLKNTLAELLSEKAPPGEKYERMVKHIKKGYAGDGKLTDKEKSIAFATAWKAKNQAKGKKKVKNK